MSGETNIGLIHEGAQRHKPQARLSRLLGRQGQPFIALIKKPLAVSYPRGQGWWGGRGWGGGMGGQFSREGGNRELLEATHTATTGGGAPTR